MKRGMEMGMIGNIVCVIVLVMGIWLLVIMMIVRMSGSTGIVWGCRRSRLGSGIVLLVRRMGLGDEGRIRGTVLLRLRGRTT